MALKMACAETGAKCPFEVVADTKEELMQHVGIHVNMAHPEMAKNPPSPDMIAKLIHEV
jgi:predicted small metal-binding protein